MTHTSSPFAAQSGASSLGSEKIARTMKILVVEDARLMALVLQRHLYRLGHQDVVIVESAEEALENLKNDGFGLMIVDWSLPGMSGVELVKELRAGEKYRHLPIIMVTGHSERESVVEALQAGVNEYLVKPVHYETLAEKLKQLLGISIREAGPEDAGAIAELILELADYERLAHEAAPSAVALRRHMAPAANPRCEAVLAVHDASEEVIGFALYFQNYSTFLTRWGLYLEDVYVKPDFRGRGAGFGLLKRVAQIAVERGCERLDFSVLNWNELAIDFYRKLGAKDLSTWAGMRLTGEALQDLGRPSSAP